MDDRADGFAEFLRWRGSRVAAWGNRDGYTPADRCALALFAGHRRMEAVILSDEETLRKLWDDGLITKNGVVTKAGSAMINRWVAEDMEAKIGRMSDSVVESA